MIEPVPATTRLLTILSLAVFAALLADWLTLAIGLGLGIVGILAYEYLTMWRAVRASVIDYRCRPCGLTLTGLHPNDLRVAVRLHNALVHDTPPGDTSQGALSPQRGSQSQ